MNNCACAWTAVRDIGTGQPAYFEQRYWCRAHMLNARGWMEAEIAKQGQAAGSPPLDSGNNVDGAQTIVSGAKKAQR